MSIKDRLQIVMKMNNLTNASFADKINVQRSSISHIMAGRNKPSLDFIQKTLTSFPKIDALWLITGKQSAVKPVENTFQESKKEEIESADLNYLTNDDHHIKTDVNSPITNNKAIKRVVVYFEDGTYVETTTT
jgi:transcriptional regulator with XRE-family HTH domain